MTKVRRDPPPIQASPRLPHQARPLENVVKRALQQKPLPSHSFSATAERTETKSDRIIQRIAAKCLGLKFRK